MAFSFQFVCFVLGKNFESVIFILLAHYMAGFYRDHLKCYRNQRHRWQALINNGIYSRVLQTNQNVLRTT